MSISARSISTVGLLARLTIGFVLPLCAEEHGTRAQETLTFVLYEGPLSHEENWVIKADQAGPNNMRAGVNGGTCSLIPSDIGNAMGSSFERVTFEAQRDDLGIWHMEWKDSVTGTASDGNAYTYQQRQAFTGVTTDGRRPRPSRAAPSPGTEDTGFLSSVPPIRKQSPYFSFVNRGKESIVINLIEESDRAVFLNMVRQVRPTSSPNFRPGVMPGRLA